MSRAADSRGDSGEVEQIQVDRAFSLLGWDLEAVLARHHARARIVSDQRVSEIVRNGELVGWEKGWTVRSPEAVRARCSIRSLSAFPGRLWLVLNGVPVFDVRGEDLRSAMLGSGSLVEHALKATEEAFAKNVG